MYLRRNIIGFIATCVALVLPNTPQVNALHSINGTTYDLSMEPIEEGFCDTTKQLSGYFKIEGSKSKNYFYWFFESRDKPSTDPLIIWLTGGPGCSSILALLQENGPCSVNDDLTLKRNPYSWTEHANIIWVDQPIGVGFSYGDVSEYDTNEKQVGDDMYHFLQAFLAAEPKYASQGFFVFGESYAGHYVPAIAHRVFEGNKNLDKENKYIHINLQGFGIGNGLTDPQVQYKYYPEMAFHNTYNIQAVSYTTYLAMKAATIPCTKMIAACQSNNAMCLAAETFCNAALMIPYQASGLNVYDIREKCKVMPMCYDFSNVEKFLRLESTLKALHISKKSSKWTACNMIVHSGFAYDWMKDFQDLVTPMIESGIRGLVYAGDADFIVNWMGCKAWTLALEWKNKKEFNEAPDSAWLVDGKPAGKLRHVKNFSFLQVFEAGHMVPLDQPKNALAMLDQFIGNKMNPSTHDPSEILNYSMEQLNDEIQQEEDIKSVDDLMAIM